MLCILPSRSTVPACLTTPVYIGNGVNWRHELPFEMIGVYDLWNSFRLIKDVIGEGVVPCSETSDYTLFIWNYIIRTLYSSQKKLPKNKASFKNFRHQGILCFIFLLSDNMAHFSPKFRIFTEIMESASSADSNFYS